MPELSVKDFSFEGPYGSQGSTITKVGKNHFRVTLGQSPHPDRTSNQLQFTILRNARDNDLRIDAFFPGTRKHRFNQDMCSWSYDRKNWHPVMWEKGTGDAAEKGDTIIFPSFEEDNIFFGAQFPLCHEDVEELMQKWGQHPGTELHVIGQSIGGRNIYRLEITDPCSHHPRAIRWGHYFSHQHAGEHHAQWRMIGMINWLLSDEGADCCQRNICHFVLDMNPDATANGWYRVNAQGIDMNRGYLTTGSHKEAQARECYLLQHDLEKLMASDAPVDDFWSIHTWPGDVEIIMNPGVDVGSSLPPGSKLVDIIDKEKGEAAIKPMTVNAKRPERAVDWDLGPRVQFGISDFLVEGADTWMDRSRSIEVGRVLIRSITQYYTGTRNNPVADHR